MKNTLPEISLISFEIIRYNIAIQSHKRNFEFKRFYDSIFVKGKKSSRRRSRVAFESIHL